jgi:hypothetical protein
MGYYLGRLRRTLTLHKNGVDLAGRRQGLGRVLETGARVPAPGPGLEPGSLLDIQGEILTADRACKTSGSPDQLISERLALMIAGQGATAGAVGRRRGFGQARQGLERAQGLVGEVADLGGGGELAADPAAHHGIGGGPQVVGGVDAAGDALDRDHGLLQQHQLGPQGHVEQGGDLEQLGQQRPIETSRASRPNTGSPTARRAWAKASTSWWAGT